MNKMANRWEIPVSSMIPYLQWSELTNGEIHVWETGRHNHASYELHIILSGQCSLFINNAELTLQAGQGIVIAPDVFHAPNSVDQPFSRLSLSFVPDEEQLEKLIPGQGAFLLFSADEAIENLCTEIFAETKKGDSLFHKELLTNQFAQLMLRVFRTIQETSSQSKAVISYPKQIEDMAVIDSFFVKTDPKLRTKENLAKMLHCSQRQVLRKISTLYGMSFQKKQMLSRIDTAQHLLRVTDKNIEEICTLVGYSDTAAFYKAFKLYAGTTPVKYRKEIKNRNHPY